MGNDEILSITLDTTDDNSNKRNGRTSPDPSPKVKRLRRTLIDDYLTKKEDKKGKEEAQGEDEEEEEFEVQSIIDLKKTQVCMFICLFIYFVFGEMCHLIVCMVLIDLCIYLCFFIIFYLLLL